MKTILLFMFLFTGTCSAQECLIRCEPNIKDGGGACGTGFFISSDEILTAYHVVENEKKVRIEFNDRCYVVDVVKYDKDKDLALLKTKGTNDFYEICNIGGVLEQEVFCRGYPRGVWTIHKSSGKIKTINKVRSLEQDSKPSERYSAWMNVINGMSGGPLLTKDEKVIGVLSTKSVSGPMRAHFVSWTEIRKFLNEDSQ